jgi:AAA+ superfamily predicted ATPase
MANPFRDLLLNAFQPPAKRPLVEAIEPRRTFHDVIVPESTRRALRHALSQIQKHDLIFNRWGLGERHTTGLGLVFNFAGPPGTGKTICAEAIAHALGKRLLIVRYSEMESLWAGETGKNVVAVFQAAQEQDAVLFFDEADAIAGRRFAAVTQGYQREANTVVNVLLKELEEFDGVVIFATNLAANFDPAFERRIHTHILFEMPGTAERAQIWRVQLHADKTPLAEDVDFQKLAEKYAVSGGDIKNAVLKAAQLASAEPGPDEEKRIHQRHFEAAMEAVVAAKKVMEQSLFETGDGSHPLAQLAGATGVFQELTRRQEEFGNDLKRLQKRVAETENIAVALPGIVERFDEAAKAAQTHLRAELSARLDGMSDEARQLRAEYSAQWETAQKQRGDLATSVEELREGHRAAQERLEKALIALRAQFETALAQATARQDAEQQSRLQWQEEWKLRARNQMLVLGGLIALSAGLIILIVRSF